MILLRRLKVFPVGSSLDRFIRVDLIPNDLGTVGLLRGIVGMMGRAILRNERLLEI